MAEQISRRDFLKLGGLSLGSLAFNRFKPRENPLIINKKESELVSGNWIDAKGVPITLVPLRDDWFLDYNADLIQLNLSTSIPIQADNITRVVQTNGSKGLFQTIAGDKYNIVSFPYFDGSSPYLGIAYIKEGKEQKINDEILGGYIYSSEKEMSQFKVKDMQLAIENILKFQKDNDGFANGKYSLAEILGDKGFAGVAGMNDFAKTLAKSLRQMAEKGQAVYDDRGIPVSDYKDFSEGISDEVRDKNKSFGAENGELNNRFDFIWKFSGQEKLYLWIDAEIIQGTDNDRRLTFSMTWRKKPQTESGINGNNGQEKKASWDEIREMVNAAYPEESNSRFQDLIEKSDRDAKDKDLMKLERVKGKIKRFLKSDEYLNPEWFGFYYSYIYYLQRLVNDYKAANPFTLEDYQNNLPHPKTGLGSFIKEKMQKDGFYSLLPGKMGTGNQIDPTERLDAAIRNMDDWTYSDAGVPLQCFVWTSFLGAMEFPLSPKIINPEIHFKHASELISDDIKNRLKGDLNELTENKMKYVKTLKIEDVQAGDMFVRYGGNTDNHIGAVIGKKTTGARTVLLVTDSNRENDGIIRVFEVDRKNFRIIFGEGKNTPPIVIRNEEISGGFRENQKKREDHRR